MLKKKKRGLGNKKGASLFVGNEAELRTREKKRKVRKNKRSKKKEDA